MQDTFETDVTVTSLEPFTLYTVQVQASNFYSDSPTTLLPSNVNHFMTKPGSQYTQSVRHYQAASECYDWVISAIDRDCFPIISDGNLYQETRSSSVFICRLHRTYLVFWYWHCMTTTMYTCPWHYR